MNFYESIIIIDASLPDEEIQAATERITGIITGSDGEMLKVNPWGRRKLGYPINKHSRGFYVLLLFNAPSGVIKKMEDFFKVFDPVVKFMAIRLEKKQKEAALKSLAEEALAAEEAKVKPEVKTEVKTEAEETKVETKVETKAETKDV